MKTKYANKINKIKTGHKTNETTKENYIKFLSLPNELRLQEFGYKTKKEFSKKNKVSLMTMWRWERDKELWKSFKLSIGTWLLNRTSKVLEAFYQKILTNPDAYKVKVWFELLKVFSPDASIFENIEETGENETYTKFVFDVIDKDKDKEIKDIKLDLNEDKQD